MEEWVNVLELFEYKVPIHTLRRKDLFCYCKWNIRVSLSFVTQDRIVLHTVDTLTFKKQLMSNGNLFKMSSIIAKLYYKNNTFNIQDLFFSVYFSQKINPFSVLCPLYNNISQLRKRHDIKQGFLQINANGHYSLFSFPLRMLNIWDREKQKKVAPISACHNNFAFFFFQMRRNMFVLKKASQA